MLITNIIKLTYDAPDNAALDDFDADTDRHAERIGDDSRGFIKTEVVKRTTIVPTPGGLDEGQIEVIKDELLECLNNTDIDYRHNTTGETRKALINYLAGLGVPDLPEF